MLIKHLSNFSELQKLKSTEFEMIWCYKRCIDCNNLEHAKIISKKILSISRQIMKLEHKIYYTI